MRSSLNRYDKFNKKFYHNVQKGFLKLAKKMGNKTENGKMMFVYQAQKSFQRWHKILPVINNEVLDLVDD